MGSSAILQYPTIENLNQHSKPATPTPFRRYEPLDGWRVPLHAVMNSIAVGADPNDMVVIRRDA
jgi:hypothetical protein